MSLSGSFTSKDINGTTYALRYLHPQKVITHGYALLSSVLAPALKDAGQSAEATLGSMLPTILGGVMSQMSSVVVQNAIKDVMATGTVIVEDGKELELSHVWTTHFIGKSGDLSAFVMWALTEQFSDFFAGMVDQLKELTTVLASKLVSTK